MPFDLLDYSQNYSYSQRVVLLNSLVVAVENPFIVPVKRFNSFKEGWEFVEANNSEGLCLRNNNNWFKCKILKEEKIEIVAHEVGKDKGTFILKNGSRISGTSSQFVIQYTGIKNRGQRAIAEIEFPFITKEGKYFQPRLRQITESENNG
jgi:ATP-dependent DNA ligase